MKYIHYECLKNWLNSKIEEDISVDSENPEIDVITYNRKDISCELCKEKLPDYVKLNDKFYNISFYKPKFEEFIVLESMRADKHKAKFIHIMSLDNKNCINIGRANECELSISELSVSRFHCIIHKDEGDLFIEDNSSKFGTLILIQNNNMFMNDYIPLKVQISKTYIKFKTIVPFKFNCCKDPFTLETKKYDYQSQNRKCFDILSYFIIKENNQNQEGEDEDEKNSKNDEKLIDDDHNKNAKDEKDVEIESEVNKDLIDEKSCKEEIHSKNNHLDNKSEIENEQKTHSNRIRKINIKKGKNDATELPELDKINIEHFKENMSIMAEKEIKSPLNVGNVNVHQSKTISLIRLNKSDGTYDKTIANPNLGASHNNTGKIVTNQAIINDYKNKK
jgi:pSer/pThr/pTyr-binding forkhead associated (FHA) protein